MSQGKKKFYITTPIYYTNNVPHLGHAYSSTVADVLARYHRASGENVYFQTGTADHGDKIKRASDKANMAPQEFTDVYAEKFKELYAKLNISYDGFIRNSDKEQHWPGAQALWRELTKSGDIYWKAYEGLYCVGCEKFVTQKDLIDGKCPDHDKVPETVKEENYFFRLSKYSDKVRKLISENEIKIFPASRKAELLAFIDSGLEDVSFSRPKSSLAWGIPVPDDSRDQTMYVWCEELSNYISALGYGTNDHARLDSLWPADLHVMGKEIFRFHVILWPAMLMSAGLPTPKSILAHGMILSGGKKMSKTIGNVIDPNAYVDQYGTDAVRYYFAREISPFEDGDFTDEKFIESYNANLANGLGNLVSRVFKMSVQYFEGKVSQPSGQGITFGTHSDVETYFEKEIWPKYNAHMDAFEIHKGADIVWDAIGELDRAVSTHEPFKLVKTDKEKTEAVLWSLLFGISEVTKLLKPFIPETVEKIEGVFNTNEGVFSVTTLNESLFPRIDSSQPTPYNLPPTT